MLVVPGMDGPKLYGRHFREAIVPFDPTSELRIYIQYSTVRRVQYGGTGSVRSTP
jgi:hypothetical protein